VDITLRVVVKQAAGTLLLFQPEYLHGTTRLCGAQNRLCVITFSTHILKAYQIAVEGTKLEAGDGAGEGDTDWIHMILIVITPVLASTFKLQVNKRGGWRPVVYRKVGGEKI
jgi:hypothetical protein